MMMGATISLLALVALVKDDKNFGLYFNFNFFFLVNKKNYNK